MTLNKNQFSRKIVILLSIFLFVVNGALGFILVQQSKNDLKKQMSARMLDVSKSAAALIDGDVLEKLQKEDKDTET